MACRVVVDALEDVGEVGLGVEALILAVSMRVMARARVSPPVSEPAKSQWLASDADGAHGALGGVRRGNGPPDRFLTLLTVDGHAAVLEE